MESRGGEVRLMFGAPASLGSRIPPPEKSYIVDIRVWPATREERQVQVAEFAMARVVLIVR
jgi:hypothetical protein